MMCGAPRAFPLRAADGAPRPPSDGGDRKAVHHITQYAAGDDNVDAEYRPCCRCDGKKEEHYC